ncbi:MAG TPA: carboxypeptidase regulatory-like domain-containing protein [Vicinamibacterales bacterium]|nr:carboxypeptidase regulatory-like domain-containing protein [Vicinamibacterales bacterium]
MRLLFVPLLALIVACGSGNSPTAPSTVTAPSPTTTTPTTPTAVTPPASVAVSVAGVVTNADTGRPVGGATVTIGGRSATTDGNGYYSISGVTSGSATMTVTASGFNNSTEGVTVQTIDTRIDRRLAPLWVRSGTGNTVFDMPSYVSRVRIQGTWAQRDTSNFIVYVSGRLVVNEILRTSITYDGTHIVPSGNRVVEITSSSAISWTFTQIQ